MTPPAPNPAPSLSVTRVAPDRAPTDAELDELVPLFSQYRAFYAQAPDAPRERAFLAERLARSQAVVFLARLDASPAGFVLLYPGFSSVSLAPRWTLNDLFVAEPARRAGVADALMTAAEAFARAQAVVQLQLLTDRANDPAQALYRRRAWSLDDRFLRFTLKL